MPITERDYTIIQNSEFILELLETAESIFRDCGVLHDFGLQSAGARLVFGGTNRLCFSARHGWLADESYCTPNFLAAWKAHPLYRKLLRLVSNFKQHSITELLQALFLRCRAALLYFNTENRRSLL